MMGLVCLVIRSCSKGLFVLDKGRMAAIFHSFGAICLGNGEVIIETERSLTFCCWYTPKMESGMFRKELHQDFRFVDHTESFPQIGKVKLGWSEQHRQLWNRKEGSEWKVHVRDIQTFAFIFSNAQLSFFYDDNGWRLRTTCIKNLTWLLPDTQQPPSFP